jgi:hypothetical protein
MRAKTVIHVEYEVVKAILNSKEIGMVIEMVKDDLVPVDDEYAEKRFNMGVKSVSQLFRNIADRRLHRIPKNHPDYRGKEE